MDAESALPLKKICQSMDHEDQSSICDSPYCMVNVSYVETMPRQLDQFPENEPLLASAEAASPEERNGKADDFPKDRCEAMQHIEAIRRGKEKYRGDEMVQGLLKYVSRPPLNCKL